MTWIPSPGAMFASMRLLRPLREGRDGSTWIGSGTIDGVATLLAVKLVATPYHRRRQHRFEVEVDLLKEALSPSFSATLVAAGWEAGHTYLVTTLQAGESVAELLTRRRAMDLREACSLALDVLQGLAPAHQRMLAHGAVRSTNVVRTSSGRAKLLDWSIARMTDPTQALNPEDDIRGVGSLVAGALGGRVGLQPGGRAVAEAIQACLARRPAARPNAHRALLMFHRAQRQLEGATHCGGQRI